MPFRRCSNGSRDDDTYGGRRAAKGDGDALDVESRDAVTGPGDLGEDHVAAAVGVDHGDGERRGRAEQGRQRGRGVDELSVERREDGADPRLVVLALQGDADGVRVGLDLQQDRVAARRLLPGGGARITPADSGRSGGSLRATV